ncbi:DNA-directed RNA polymerase subunit beta [Candidatus Zixiibacteriota bacterium]
MQKKDFSKITPIIDVPNLLDVQLRSFEDFLQKDVPPEKRQLEGLQGVFKDIFQTAQGVDEGITDIHNNYRLNFVKYEVGEPKYSVRECQERDMTYAGPLKATLQLVVYQKGEKGEKVEKKPVKDIIEQEVYLGDLPLITPAGTFVINGAERVIVSQLHRSPGIFFSEEIHPNGKRLYSARIIPYRGSWVEFTLDINDLMFVHIDRRRKIPVTILLRALDFPTDESLLDLFYNVKSLKFGKALVGRVAAAPVVDTKTGEVLIDSNEEITEDHITSLRKLKITEMKVISDDISREAGVLRNTMNKDKSSSKQEALYKIYNLLRPGDPPNLNSAQALLDRLFFNPKRYNLGRVGRYRLNKRLILKIADDTTILTKEDFIEIVRYLLRLRNGEGFVDDIDHLGNRRVRSVGELLSDQFRIGLTRMARTIRERMSLWDEDSINPHELVNARTVSAVIGAFFGSSQLSQFMDQTNPLAALTHKRRLSALGPGGLTRERAGFEVRDVHHTHYGRICPIETPEGPNIGLIASLSTYARVNKLGFIETPYRKVSRSKVGDQIEYLSADQEDMYTIAQANAPLDKVGKFQKKLVMSRRRADYPLVPPKEVDYMDVSPKQLVSVAASLIPFLEHDDANRALMGSNMQRQAVPLLSTEAPLVGTGMESRAARDSGAVLVAGRAGVVEAVTADMISIQPDQTKGKDDISRKLFGLDEYYLTKFKRSNQDTCINQRPLVHMGEKVKAGQVIADGPSTNFGELSLGTNVLVAFMPWHGYNFEDAIIVSEKLVRQDRFTSIHIQEFELQVRETKRGEEEITREIPNVGEDALRNLDERGIIRVGAEVEAGDILVGKVTPKGETELSPEERLLRAIFGEKAGDVRDASLKAPPGMKGIVIDTKVFSRKERSPESKKIEKREIKKLESEAQKHIDRIRRIRDQKIAELLNGQMAQTIRSDQDGSILVRAGRKFTDKFLAEHDLSTLDWGEGWTKNDSVNQKIARVLELSARRVHDIQLHLENEKEKVIRGDMLPPGVLQLVKVHVAMKRKLSVGDKMAGRHGNKGVVAKIVPEEDMPYLPDGTPVEILLNPLGVPSRMNVGQILETHLGWAAKKLGIRFKSPVFDGANLEEIKKTLQEAGLPASGKLPLYDGRTGVSFYQEITVGYIYMMKLSHLVDDKIHARSIGPYSLVTQQPLGGKAQFGGQRFGEMEVWALEAYGAAYALQEMLTVKSDDVTGRSRTYEAIVKGENPPEPGIPESFNVLVKELQSLGLDVQLEEQQSE